MPLYDYEIAIAGDTLDTIATGLEGRFLKYTSGMRRGSNIIIPHRHGELSVPDKYFAGSDVMLELFLPSDVHASGAQALSELAERLSAQDLVTVSQADPHRGNIQARVELLTDPVSTQNEFVYMFGLRNPSGFWEDVTESSQSGSPPTITTGGDRPIDDMVITFSGPGFLEHTDDLGVVSRITIDSDAGAGTYVVDVGAATVLEGSTPRDEFLTVTQPWWMKFQPASAQSFTADVSVTVDWRNKWS